jgi:hypothetical protein
MQHCQNSAPGESAVMEEEMQQPMDPIKGGWGGGGSGRTMRVLVLGDAPPWSARTPWRLCSISGTGTWARHIGGGICSRSTTRTPTRSRLHKEQCALTHWCSPTHARYVHTCGTHTCIALCASGVGGGGACLTKTYRHQCGARETQRRACGLPISATVSQCHVRPHVPVLVDLHREVQTVLL